MKYYIYENYRVILVCESKDVNEACSEIIKYLIKTKWKEKGYPNIWYKGKKNEKAEKMLREVYEKYNYIIGNRREI